MIRYKYNNQFTPPAPFVHVSLRVPGGGGECSDLPAQVDSGADRTVIPLDIVAVLSLEQMGEIPVGGIGGHVAFLPTFLVELEVRSLRPVTVEVAASKGEPFVLLGRDVLQHFHTSLDGPQAALEMG